MRKALCLIMILVAACIYSCSKGPKPIYHYVSHDVKADFSFKPGTYWIMRDSVSGRIDSFFVTSYKDEINQTETGGNDYPAEYTENISINISDYNTNPSHVADSLGWVYSLGAASAGLVYRAIPYYPFYTIGAIGYGDFFDYPKSDSFRLSAYHEADRDTGIVNRIFPTFQINSHSFNIVAVISHHYFGSFRDTTSGNLTYFGYNDLFYVCPKIGIIKMRMNHYHYPLDTVDRVWEIQRWNIKM